MCILCPEQGLFLALDLGGTNFRVILLELANGVVVREEVKHYHIGEELRLGSGERLFDFLAECVSDFVRSQSVNGTRLPLGKDNFIHNDIKHHKSQLRIFIICIRICLHVSSETGHRQIIQITKKNLEGLMLYKFFEFKLDLLL